MDGGNASEESNTRLCANIVILALEVHIINIKSIMLSSMILFPSKFLLVAFKINLITSKIRIN